MALFSFVNYVKVTMDSRKDPDLGDKEIEDISKQINSQLNTLEKLAHEKMHEGVPPSAYTGIITTVQSLLKSLLYQEEWKHSVDADRPWEYPHHVYTSIDGSTAEFNHMSGSTLHTYNEKPETIEIPLRGLEQDGNWAFQGQLGAGLINHLSSVPALNSHEQNFVFAAYTSLGIHPQDKWQRQLEADRVIKIGKFLDHKKSYLFNEIMLHADLNDDSLSFEYDKEKNEGSLRISFDFLRQLGSTISVDNDRNGSDLRPLWIVDGQHRVRGASLSERGKGLNLPILLTVSGGISEELKVGLPPNEVAKLFSEINTLSEALSGELKYYTGNRFRLASSNKEFNFSLDEEDGHSNHIAYLLACKLCHDAAGPLFNSIALVNRKTKDRGVQTEIKTWMGYVPRWLKSQHNGNGDRMIQEVQAYYSGMRDAMEENRKPRINGWDWDRKRERNILRLKSSFSITYEMYPLIRRLAFHISGKDPESESEEDWLIDSDFFEAMKPWSTLPLRDKRIREGLMGRDARSKYLKCWLMQYLWAVHLRGDPYSDVSRTLDMKTSGEIGVGILAPPAIPEVEVVQGEFSLPFKEDFALEVERPWNAEGKLIVDCTYSLGVGMDVPVNTQILEETRFHPNGGWNIADFENAKLRDKQVISVVIPRAEIPESAVKIDLVMRFASMPPRETGDAYVGSASL